MEVWKIIFLSKWVICRFHVNLPGCNFQGENKTHARIPREHPVHSSNVYPLAHLIMTPTYRSCAGIGPRVVGSLPFQGLQRMKITRWAPDAFPNGVKLNHIYKWPYYIYYRRVTGVKCGLTDRRYFTPFQTGFGALLVSIIILHHYHQQYDHSQSPVIF